MNLVELLWEEYHHHSHNHHYSHDHPHSGNGCYHDHYDGNGHDNNHDHQHNRHYNEYEADEHVWTSPLNTASIVLVITEILAEMDSYNAEYFRANAVAYIQELEALDQAFRQMVHEAARHTVVFGDRFPFRYLTELYGLHHYAAFIGCSSETQASPATVAFLIEKVQEENIPVVFYIEFSDRLIANVIAEAAGARLLELHSIHNVSHADFEAGVTYLELMTRNLEQLREALN